MAEEREMLAGEFLSRYAQLKIEFLQEERNALDFIIGVLSWSAFGWGTRTDLENSLDVIKSHLLELKKGNYVPTNFSKI